MFAGVAPYPIVIAKKLKHAGIKAKIISNELNANANKYTEKNIALNKLSDYIQIVDGDARDLPKKLKNKNVLNFMDSKNSPQIYYQVHNIPERSYANMGWAGGELDYKKIPKSPKFDIILMPRPQLKETFLKTALALSKKGTTIFYHGFGTKEEVLNEIKKDAGKKIGKIKIRKAGDISPHRYRWQAEFKVYN